MSAPQHIVITGGGFAGTALAKQLERLLPRTREADAVSAPLAKKAA